MTVTVKKERESNFELLRLICMIMVVFLHLNTYTIGSINQAEIISTPLTGFIRTFAKQLCIIAVNVFVLISGWFGIKANNKGFLKLMFQVYFFGLILLIPSAVNGTFNVVALIKVLCGGVMWWFIPSYIVLYLLSPIINSYIENKSPKDVGLFLLMFFGLEVIYGWIGCNSQYEDGCSALSFIGLYTLARWLRLNYQSKIGKFSAIHYFILYLIVTVFAACIAFYGVKYLDNNLKMYAYCNPFVIISSVLFLLGFSRISIRNSRVINWFSESALAIYLIHMHHSIQPIWRPWYKEMYFSLGGFKYIILVIVTVLVYSVFCVLLDKVRIVLWNYILSVYNRKKISKIEQFNKQ